MRRRGLFRIVPSSGDSSPKIILKRVVFPVPFGPTRPTRVCGRRCAEALSNKTFVENCLWTDSICSMRARLTILGVTGGVYPPPQLLKTLNRRRHEQAWFGGAG